MAIKILFGSKMLKLNNPRDEDWKEYKDNPIKGIDPCIEVEKKFVKSFVEGRNLKQDVFKARTLYQMSCGFHEHVPDYPFAEFNILSHRRVWIAHLKQYLNLPELEQKAISENKLYKRFYHFAYQYYMIKENTHWISEEGLAIVQKIHDLEMPSSYFYELRDLINSLPEE